MIALSERQGARSAATVADARRLGGPGPERGAARRGAAARRRRRRPRRLARDPLQPALGARARRPVGARRPQRRRRAHRGRAQPRRTHARGRRFDVSDSVAGDPLRHRDAGANRRAIGHPTGSSGLASIPGTARSRSSGGSESANTCTSSTPPPNGRAARSRLPGHPAARTAGSRYYPAATYAPDGRSVIVAYMSLFAPPHPCPCSCAASTPATARRSDRPSASPPGLPGGRSPLSTRTGACSSRRDEATYAIDADTLRVVRRYPVGAVSTGYQPRRRHARARRRGRKRSPARPRLRAGADPDGTPRRGGPKRGLQPRRAHARDRRTRSAT